MPTKISSNKLSLSNNNKNSNNRFRINDSKSFLFDSKDVNLLNILYPPKDNE